MEGSTGANGPPAPDAPDLSGSAASGGDKGLKGGAIGFASSVVIGVASTAPGYSLAASLGFVVAAGVGLFSPAVLWVAFLPMLCIAFAYYYMNRQDPDCGTTFTWVTSAMGPSIGWIGGWAIIVADVIVMANLAQIAGLYSFLLFGIDDAVDPRRHLHRRRLDRDHDRHLLHRDRALGPHSDRAARRRDPRPRRLRGRRSHPGLRGRLPRFDRSQPRAGSTRSTSTAPRRWSTVS